MTKGFTPKQHLEMNLLEQQQRQQQAWQDQRDIAERTWREQQAERERQWRNEDITRADQHHTSNLWVAALAGILGALATLAAVSFAKWLG